MFRRSIGLGFRRSNVTVVRCFLVGFRCKPFSPPTSLSPSGLRSCRRPKVPSASEGACCRKWDMGVLSELPQTNRKDRGHVCSGSCKFRHVLRLGGWENEGRINYASGTIKYSAISGGRSVVKFKGGYEMATFCQFAL